MNTVQRITKNAAVLYASFIITSLLGLFFSIFIARTLGDIVFGKYSFAIAFTAIFSVFMYLGFNALITREVARDKSRAPKYLGNLAIIRAILCLVGFGAIALIINLMGYPQDVVNVVIIFGIYNMLSAFTELFRATFIAFERMEYVALTSAIRQIVVVGLGLTVLFLGYGLVELATVFIIAGIFDLILSFLICGKRFAKPKLEIDFDFWKRATKIALPISFISIGAIMYIKIDTVMLSVMKGDAVVGWYSAAYNLVLAFKPIPQLLMISLFPLMARFSISSRSSAETICKTSFRYLLILGLPLAMGASLLADRIILLLYGSQFTMSVIALQILAWDILLLFLCECLSYVLVSIDKQNQMAVGIGSCVIINIVLNLILIPPLSYVGAGIATLVTETLLLVSFIYLVSKYLCRLPIHKLMAKPLAACFIMGAFVYLCRGINLPLLIASAAVLYFAILYLMREFSQGDFDLLKAAIRIPRNRGSA